MPWTSAGLPHPAHPGAMAAMLALLALLCLLAAYGDMRARRIANRLCLAIAALAVPYWFALAGGEGLLTLLRHAAWALLLAVPLCALFAARLLGGGDVKLLLALALWIVPHDWPLLIVATVLLGGLVALGAALHHRIARSCGAPSVPYGVAIVAAALLVLVPVAKGLAVSLASAAG
ncbi:A24 family peptidase [Novosphingobium album (ex Liu et al. 2023)]|uniref:Prepilin peptidase n=1 Tax=Novosphingobium album (ex Liu et al. 2023) TaxID=3031130 RepID=A0ABT5WKF3_9SPHN|nr:prepilin peptidase [Novosphingobium album (ex Liu et al. 2023)]MDE8650510.1 prepilin peptidase [Novosphingobium album (ex Liu et al. 2023)]